MVPLGQNFYTMPVRPDTSNHSFPVYSHSQSQAPFPARPQHLDITIPSEPYSALPTSAHDPFPSPLAVDFGFLKVDTPHYLYNPSSPGVYPLEKDAKISSSDQSTDSAASSAFGSPQSNPCQLSGTEWMPTTMGAYSPGIVGQTEFFLNSYSPYPTGMEEFANFDVIHKGPGFVDPSLIHPEFSRTMNMVPPPYDQTQQAFPTLPSNNSYPPSPSNASSHSSVRAGSLSPYLRAFPQSPYSPFQPPMEPLSRRQSAPFLSPNYSDPNSFSTPITTTTEDGKERQKCPHPDCGKLFKDLKAHMLTHQTERPEKCPIVSCEYHIKGFARKYDKNRHTLTHYKGTMVCGFCPGSGSASEKSFNRADVFKRHLTTMHGVEQTPPNGRKKSSAGSSDKALEGYPPDATGKCSTCSQTFANAQDFYEHLDECVLRVVQQEDPTDIVNANHLAEVENDKNVLETLEKNNVVQPSMVTEGHESEGDDDDDMLMPVERGTTRRNSSIACTSAKCKGNPPNGVQKSRGMTHSRGGVTLAVKRTRKHKREYPASWGFDPNQMNMRKRVLAVFDGPRRLAKDDMMLSKNHEVRLKLADGKSYVTDLDVQTLKRATSFLDATPEEKGIWISDDPTHEERELMQKLSQSASVV